MVAELIAGQNHISITTLIWCVYTWPEVAVGQTEEQLKEAGIAYKLEVFLQSIRSCESKC
jgi:dihydrolipoamide dehydrogenase